MLIWSPTYSHVADTASNQSRLLLIISPFIKLRALEQLLTACKETSGLKVVVRWAAKDLLSGASDLEVYPFLSNRGIELYVHTSIHLKLFVFESGRGFHTSGNVTERGLGLAPESNVEIGCDIDLRPNDWKNLYRLLADSLRVDDRVYEVARQYMAEHPPPETPPLMPLVFLPDSQRDFSTLSLPATESAAKLFAFYAGRGESLDREAIAASMHDLLLYDIPEGLAEPDFMHVLRDHFSAHSFVQAVAKFVHEERSANFGMVTAWLQRNCSDKPVPYRWELKGAVRRLYDWLAFGFDEITWDRPRHSMVIRWHDRA